MDYFANQLRSLFQATDVTRRELAAALDVPVTTVCEWARGEATPDLWELREIADYFDLPCAYFLDDANDLPDLDELTAELGLSPDTLNLLESLANRGPKEVLDAVDGAVFNMLECFQYMSRNKGGAL